MSYRPSDESPDACALAAWGDDDYRCVPGETAVHVHLGRLVALAFCLRCDALVAGEMVELEDGSRVFRDVWEAL